MNLSFLSGPIIGAIIGLITNGIAIRMLFRPLKPVRFLGMTLPFTPGLIPKEKSRIAKSLGDVVAGELLNEEVIKSGLLSAEMDQKIKTALNHFIAEKSTSDETLNDVFLSFVGKEQGALLADEISTKIVDISYERMTKLELGVLLSEIAAAEIVANLQGSMFSMLVSDNLINSAKVKMSDIIEKLIAEKGKEILENIVLKEGTNLMDKKICDLYTQYEARLPEFIEWVIGAYHKLIEKNLHALLHALDLSQLVENQINSYDVLTFEKIILDIMSKELKAIVWLGGLLGFVMGLVMLFF